MKTILIIEDTDFISETIATTLRFEGYNTCVAEDGVAGLDAIANFKPDLILCDVSMPRLDGFGVLSELRKNKELGTVPFIFLTAKAEKADMRRGMELGADDYLTKPFTATELIAAVTTQLAKQEKVAQHYEEKLEELRGNISYALPHEFRTALNGILGYSDIIIDMARMSHNGVALDADELLEMAVAIKDSGRRLHKMTENFLVYTQITSIAGKPEAVEELKRFTVENASEIIADTATIAARDTGRESDLALDVCEAKLRMSSENLYKIAQELMSNAFKFSLLGTPVSVRCTIEDGAYVIHIHDRGRGMTADQIESIGAYNQFRRDVYEQQGVGLGLVISKMLTELHDGKFTIDSEVGAQTAITVVLPVAS